jgi:hypothetical protein
MRRTAAVVAFSILALVAACAERDQSTANAKRTADKPAWDSTNTKYDAAGYTHGDKGAWESQLRERAQSQNDYAPRK